MEPLWSAYRRARWSGTAELSIVAFLRWALAVVGAIDIVVILRRATGSGDQAAAPSASD